VPPSSRGVGNDRRAPQQANFKRTAASIGTERISKADTLGRLVDDPGDASGFDSAEIGYVVVMRKVDDQRVDHYGRRFAALFHCDEGTPSYWPDAGLGKVATNVLSSNQQRGKKRIDDFRCQWHFLSQVD
jgi:hypothetical protein